MSFMMNDNNIVGTSIYSKKNQIALQGMLKVTMQKMNPTNSYFSQELMGKMCGQCKRNVVLSKTRQIGFFVNDASSGPIPDINCLPNHHCMKHLFSARLTQSNRNVPSPKERTRW